MTAPEATKRDGRRGARSDSSEFGSLLRRYRLAAGLSQDALAERARVSSMESARSSGGAGAYRNAKRSNRLPEALAMNPEQRRAFEAAMVRTSSPRRREGGSVTVGPWPSAGATICPPP